ncbi:hypothetical protein BGZ59_006903 [Podila verticillata]|nr:hypothetical protein BGZ59_006903 [Podila verticillata]
MTALRSFLQGPTSFRRRLLIFATTAFFIVACVNFVNLSLAPQPQGLDFHTSRATTPSDPDKQTVLILTLVRDHESWGRGRSFHDFLSLVRGFDYPMSNIRIGVLASDEKEFDAITNTLRDEDSVLWIDSDMVKIPSDLLLRMIDSGKDIITTATKFGPTGGFYDLNAWVGERITPSAEEQKVIEQGGLFVPRPKAVKYTHELQQEFGPLDSVGGTVLFVRGEIHREGVAFTTNYVIGTGWKHEGYDGIESEGLCYVAGFLGYKCWGMPRAIAEHSDN